MVAPVMTVIGLIALGFLAVGMAADRLDHPEDRRRDRS